MRENGINIEELEYNVRKGDSNRSSFYQTIRLLSNQIENEVHRICAFYEEYKNKLLTLLAAQAAYRPVLQEESQVRLEILQSEFQNLVRFIFLEESNINIKFLFIIKV